MSEGNLQGEENEYVNPIKEKSGKVTVEEVLSMEEFKGISEEEANEYIRTLEQYCLLMCQFYLETKEKEETNKRLAA